MKKLLSLLVLILLQVGLATAEPTTGTAADSPIPPERFAGYATVPLVAELDHLAPGDRRALKHMIAACKIMDRLFWHQSYGQPEALETQVTDPQVWRYAQINYGPWDRLQGNRPFVEGYGTKPPGANFYPKDLTKEEFESSSFPDKSGLYSVVRRDGRGQLITIPYSQFYRSELEAAADHLRKAAESVSDEGLRTYLNLRAEAFLNDDYQPSDLAWMAMKSNPIDVVIGPIETYEDRLFGYRAAFEGYVLVKDRDWSERLARYAEFLPQLQRALPVEEKYKQESPGTDSDLNAYDVVYYAGDCNAGSKTIAINLPNDEEVQLKMGSRRLQLKNAMRAKYDEILVPIADTLLVEEQRGDVTFDAFFANTMFHEVAHGLGIKKVVNPNTPNQTVSEALRELSGGLEENKADLLGIVMIEELTRMGELPEENLKAHYTTFMVGIFRSIRFGASSAHGIANLIRFNHFRDYGAFHRDPETGLYRVDHSKLSEANRELSRRVLTLQGDGDYDGVKAFLEEYGQLDEQLAQDLRRLEGIPTDVVFEQGEELLGL